MGYTTIDRDSIWVKAGWILIVFLRFVWNELRYAIVKIAEIYAATRTDTVSIFNYTKFIYLTTGNSERCEKKCDINLIFKR